MIDISRYDKELVKTFACLDCTYINKERRGVEPSAKTLSVHTQNYTHTILADIELSEFGEVGNVGWDAHQVILTQGELAKIGESKKFLCKIHIT